MKTKFNFRFLALVLAGIFMCFNAFAQDITVQGVVEDTFGDPVAGANVVVKGTTNGCITDLDGNFSLKAQKGATLVVSFIGYTSQEVAAAPNVHVTLSEDSELLEDVVVIGYGTARKNDLTGSVTAIKPDDKNRGVITTATDMLQGKIAGVNITNDGGAPGATSNIRIRGGSSLNASNNPLYVIDGLAMDDKGLPGMANPLSLINPADIETFTVLKDASATAIYGSRGSNGVIIITTKKGLRNQAPKVTYNGNVSVSTKKGLLEVMDADEFRTWVHETYNGAGDQYLGNANTNWQDEIYRTAVSTDHNINIQGGVASMPYRASVGFTDENGILKTSNLKRYTASFNLSPSFMENHLTFNINGKGMVARTRYANTGAIGSAVYMDPTKPVTSDDPMYDNFNHYTQWLGAAAFNDDTYPYTFNSNANRNPVSQLYGKKDVAYSSVFNGNIEATYKLHGFEDLVLHANYGANLATSRQTTNVADWSTDAFYFGNTGSMRKNNRNITFNAYAQYNHDFKALDQHFDIMGGYEWQHVYQENDRGNYWGYYRPTNNDATLAGTKYNESNPDGIWWKSENYLVSFFGRLNYSILDRYSITATVREDGSSRFSDHWSLFPSAAFAWKFKDEAFLKDQEWLTDGKLRLSYGETGQQEIGSDYIYFASFKETYNQAGDGHWYPVLGNGELQRPDAYNKDLKWETTTTYNAGIDLGFWNDRLTLSADVYKRETTDLLNTVAVAAGSNFANQVTSNIGSLENKGAELMLTIRPVQTKNWSWEVSLNGAYNKNEITELIASEGDDYMVPTGGISSGTGKQCQAHAVGHPASSFYVFQQVYDEAGKPIEGVYVDRNGDGQISDADKYFYKSPTAPWVGGLSSRLSYKQWDFSFSLRGSFDNYVFNDTQAGQAYSGIATVASYYHVQNRISTAKDLKFQSYDNVLSDYFVQNASFLKCDNITLGYNFSKLGNWNVAGRIYGAVSNVFTITKYEGVDPEVFGGIDNNLYPRPITGLIGLSLNF